jgi:hypothetical protein
MLHGKVLRPSRFRGSLDSLDDSAASKYRAVSNSDSPGRAKEFIVTLLDSGSNAAATMWAATPANWPSARNSELHPICNLA